MAGKAGGKADGKADGKAQDKQEPGPRPSGGWGPTNLLRQASEEVIDRLAVLTDAVRKTGSSAVGAIPSPLPGAAVDLLASMRSLVEQAPAPTIALDLFVEEIAAKRAMIQALQVQLASFDSQLAVLERSLGPLQEWGHQWGNFQAALLDPLTRRDRDAEAD